MSRIKVIEALAGTGKSHYIRSAVESSFLGGDQVLCLMFNKKLGESMKDKLSHRYSDSVFTIHALCYELLKANEKLPAEFTGDFENLDGRSFHKLLDVFTTLTDDEIGNFYPDIKLICVDEYQDISRKQKNVIKRLYNMYQPDLILAGDPYQNIYQYTNTQRHHDDFLDMNFEMIEEDFGSNIRRIRLRESFRHKNPRLLQLMNQFLLNHERTHLYEVDQMDLKHKHTHPTFRWFNHQRDEMNYVLQQIEKTGKNRHVLILSQKNKDLTAYKRYFEDRYSVKPDNKVLHVKGCNGCKSITISTIHKAKGLEADTVFYIGFQEISHPDDICIIYTALSRAKTYLHITTSYPQFYLEATLAEFSGLKISGKQRVITSLNRHKEVKLKKNFSLKKLQKMKLDSVTFRVKGEDAPFQGGVRNGYVPNSDRYQTEFNDQKIENYFGLDFLVKYHRSEQVYHFVFKDLNLLKKNGFRDIDCLKLIRKCVVYYFDFRIAEDDIELYDVDLCHFWKSDSKEEATLYEDLLKKLVMNSKHKTICSVGNPKKEEDSPDIKWFEEREQIMKHDFRNTLYVNHHKKTVSKKYGGITTAIYDPGRKTNGNKVNIPNLKKIEIRIGNEKLKTAGRFREGRSINKLIQALTINPNYLEDCYSKFFKEFFINPCSRSLIEDIRENTKYGVFEEFCRMFLS